VKKWDGDTFSWSARYATTNDLNWLDFKGDKPTGEIRIARNSSGAATSSRCKHTTGCQVQTSTHGSDMYPAIGACLGQFFKDSSQVAKHRMSPMREEYREYRGAATSRVRTGSNAGREESARISCRCQRRCSGTSMQRHGNLDDAASRDLVGRKSVVGPEQPCKRASYPVIFTRERGGIHSPLRHA
jgi:hypothetical protein